MIVWLQLSRKKKGKKPMKRNRNYAITRNYWLPIGCLVLILALLVTLLFAEEKYRETDENTSGDSVAAGAIVFPEIENEVLLCSGIAKKLYDNQIDVQTAIQTDNPYRPLVIEYDIGNSTGTILLSEDPELSEAKEYALQAFHTVIRLDNLKTGTVYYYKIVIGGTEQSGSFRTQESSRFIYIPGTENTRDIGGYRNADGKTVRQGKLIRGTEIDGLEYSAYALPESARQSVQDTFGFVYDFDLRSRAIYDGEYRSPLGSDVRHAFYTAPQYEQIFDSDWRPNLRRIFSDLADPSNYPMYMHCTWGKDRTGTIVFLLQGVLNMSEEDMMREYLLSGFVHNDIAENNAMDAVVSGLAKYEGNTLQEKIVDFLITDVGVTMEEITSIRNIFLSDET